MIEELNYEGADFGIIKKTENWVIGAGNYGDSLGKFSKIECHRETDEAFVLIKGEAKLIEMPEKDVYLEKKLEYGIVYVVPKGTWHHLIVERDSHVLIFENSGTTRENTDVTFFS